MSKIIGITFFFVALVLNIGSARAAINTDCTERGCVFVLTNTAGILAFYADDGTSAGSLTVSVGSGQGAISADEGYVIWGRSNSNNLWIYNATAGGNPCSVNVGVACGGGNAVVFGQHIYKPCGSNVKKINFDCSNYVNISVITNSATWTITKDSTSMYAVSAANADVAVIVPPAEISTTYSIGRQPSDNLNSGVHVAGTLYVSGTAGIYTVSLPLSGSSSLWQPLPFSSGISSANSDYLALASWEGDAAYLVPVSSPSSYISVECTGCGWVALSDDTWFTLKSSRTSAWDFSGTERSYSPLTTQVSYAVAYLVPTVIAPFCGDNIKNGSEVCDGADLDGKSCVTQGFDYGTLACAGDCMSLDTSGCHMNCGNGTIEAPEECDGVNYNSQTCQTLGFDTGTLACTSGCMLDTSGCSMNCGNGTIEAPEECDGVNHNGATCETLGFDGGTLNCSSSCTFITTSCVMDSCGNGTIDTGEDCDGSNLNGATCVSLGFSAGTLTCSPTSCSFDTTACVTYECGNGVQEPGEECDNGAANSDTEPDACRTDCSNPRCGDGVTDTGEECDDGNLIAGDGCDENCNIEVIPPDCGNGVINTGEDCDGENLNGQSCVSLGLGFTGGTLACTTACAFNTSACVTEPVCEWTQIVENLGTTIGQAQFTGTAAQSIYAANLQNLTNNCQISCMEVMGRQVVEVKTASGQYCNVRVSSPTGSWWVIWHLFSDAVNPDPSVLLVPVEEARRQNMIPLGGNTLFLHSGEDVRFPFGQDEGLSAGTEGTEVIFRITRSHPESNAAGNWLTATVETDAMRFCPSNLGENFCGRLVTGPHNTAIINIDNPGDLSGIGIPQIPPKKAGPCNGCSQTSGNSHSVALMLVLLGLLIAWLRLRPLTTGTVRSCVIKRHYK